MVLSNKKLKRKLRETVTESLITTAPKPTTTKLALESESQQLKEKLNSAKEKQKLKKKKKEKQKQKQEKSSVVEPSVVKEEGEKKKTRKPRWKQLPEDELNEKLSKKRKRESGIVDDNDRDNKKKSKKKKTIKKAKIQDDNNNDNVLNDNAINHNAVNDVNGHVTNASKVNEVDPVKVYVGGIPYYSSEDDIRSFFEGCGTVTEMDCMSFPETGKFRGIAILTFKTEAAAKRALALDGSDMGGLYLTIQPYKSTRTNVTSNVKTDFKPKLVEGYNRIYVGNLSWDITEDDLKKFFKDCKISSIRFGEDKVTGDFKGYAHVEFSDSLSLNMALKLDQKIVCGRPAKISCAVPLKGAKFQHSKATLLTQEVATTAGASDKEVADSTVPAQDKVVADISVPAPDKVVAESSVPAPAGKMKRRTCYVCGQRGHISSACPNEQTADAAKSDAS